MTDQLQKVEEKLKAPIQKTKEQILESLTEFREFVSAVRGSQDVEKRANIILNPLKTETSTNLSNNQIDFVSVCLTIKQYFPEMEPLETFAKEFLLASISKEGWGVESLIQYEQAIGEKRMLQLGLRPSQQTGKGADQNVK